MLVPMCIRMVALLAAIQGTGAGRDGGGRGDGGGASSSSDWANRAGNSWGGGSWHGGSWHGGRWGGNSWGGNQDWRAGGGGSWGGDDGQSSSSSWTNLPDPTALPVLNRSAGKGTGKGTGTCPTADDVDMESVSAASGAGALPEAAGGGTGVPCMVCKERGVSSSRLLLQIMDWQEGLAAVCFRCWTPKKDEPDDEEAFLKLAKAAWRKRSSSAKSVQRGLCVAQMAAEIQRLPTDSARNARRRIIHAAVSMTKEYIKSMLKHDAADFEAVEQAFTAWDREGELIAANPDHIPTLGSIGNLLPEEVAQYTAEIISNISEYFLCRSGSDGTMSGRTCGYFGPATAWVATDLSAVSTGGHWKCPVSGP